MVYGQPGNANKTRKERIPKSNDQDMQEQPEEIFGQVKPCHECNGTGIIQYGKNFETITFVIPTEAREPLEAEIARIVKICEPQTTNKAVIRGIALINMSILSSLTPTESLL